MIVNKIFISRRVDGLFLNQLFQHHKNMLNVFVVAFHFFFQLSKLQQYFFVRKRIFSQLCKHANNADIHFCGCFTI